MQQDRRKQKRGCGTKASICFSCSHACDGRRCGWADTLKIENLPEGAEYTISSIKHYQGKNKQYYQIKSCPKYENGPTATEPQEQNALKLAETMLSKLSESYEAALCAGDQKLIEECEILIRDNWIWGILFQAGYMECTPTDCIRAIKSRAHDTQSINVLSDWLTRRLNNVKPDSLTRYKTAIEHYRDTDMIDITGAKRLINELKTRIENTNPKDFNAIKNQICDNILPKIEKLIEAYNEKPIEKPKKSFKAHKEKPRAEEVPDSILIWLSDMTVYLNCMC